MGGDGFSLSLCLIDQFQWKLVSLELVTPAAIMLATVALSASLRGKSLGFNVGQ